ncbi:MAG: hypothetical protein KF754_01725 [Planctomycetes bacterium]|nr:hypothetical protein [Planctomycetota bacterium]
MRKRVAALRFLIDRHFAGHFVELTGSKKPATVGQHLLEKLAAAMAKPTKLLTRLVRDGHLDRQVSAFRPPRRPVLLSFQCEDSGQRDAIRRMLIALAAELAGELAGPVIPDASTVFRAIIADWVDSSGQSESQSIARKRQPVERLGHRDVTDQRLTPGPAPSKVRKRRRNKRKLAKKKPIDWSKAHPEFPDVSAQAIAWRPGRRGRPPHDALRNGRGEWIPPPGWRVIRGRWHPAIAVDGEQSAERMLSPALAMDEIGTASTDPSYQPESSPDPRPESSSSSPPEQPAPSLDKPARGDLPKQGEAPSVTSTSPE